MLRVIRNHKRAADGEVVRLREPVGRPDPARPRLAHESRPRLRPLGRGRARRLERGADARPSARLPQRPGLRRRADRHDRPRHGLRHDRHRAGFRAGQVQEARGRRLFQDHQPRRPRRACARSATTKRKIADMIAYAVGRATLADSPAINHSALRAKGLPEEAIAKVEAALRSAFDIRFVFNKWTLGAEILSGALKIPGRTLRGAGLRPACRPSASPRARSRPPTFTSAAP